MNKFKRINLASKANPLYIYQCNVEGRISGNNFTKIRISKEGATWRTTVLPEGHSTFIQVDHRSPTLKWAKEEILSYT